MKKIVGIMGAAVMLSSSMFAADFGARVVMEGSVAGGNIAVEKNADESAKANNNSAYIWKLNHKEQKDTDALVVSVNGDKAGANFQFWYDYQGVLSDDKNTVYVRTTNLWFKPIDMLKLTIGDFDTPMYNNNLDYWRDPSGGSLSEFSSWAARYNSSIAGKGAGLKAEVTPIDGLQVIATITAGTGNSLMNLSGNNASKAKDDAKVSNFSNSAYGFAVKYGNIAGLPLSVGAGWSDSSNSTTKTTGTKASHTDRTYGAKVASLGVDYGNNYAEGIYAVLNARFRLEQETAANSGKTADDIAKADSTVLRATAVVLDNYFHFQSGALQVACRAPVVLRTAQFDKDYQKKVEEGTAAVDSSYMCWSAKVTYGLNGFAPYLLMGNDLDNQDVPLVLAKKDVKTGVIGAADTFQLLIQPGITTSVGAASIDIGARVNLATSTKLKKNSTTETETFLKDVTWAVPFTVAVAF